MRKLLPGLYFILALLIFSGAYAQDDLQKKLEADARPEKIKVIATFKGTKIINAQTNETLKKRNLDFRITHLFGNMGKESGGGFHNFYGFDQSNDIRVGLDYGISDSWTIGISRCKRQENLEALTKLKILEQTTDDKTPLAITVFGDVAWSARDAESFPVYKPEYRFSYTAQLILARKFSSRFSFLLLPTYVHRNLVMDPNDDADLFSAGAGFRWKFTRSSSVIADYFYVAPNNNLELARYNALGIGYELETGGHIFSLMFTNASGILENDFIPNTIDSWSNGGYKLSFIISRISKF